MSNVFKGKSWIVNSCIFFALNFATPSEGNCQEPKTRIAILNLKAERGLDEGLVKLLNELLLTEFVKTGKYEVIGGSDLSSIMELEEKKVLLDCDEVICLSEIGGALGVDKLASANIGKVGSYYLVNVKIIDVRKARVESRVSHQVKGIEDKLVSAITTSVRELVGVKKDQREKDVTSQMSSVPRVEEEKSMQPGALPITLWSAGGAAIITGIVFGVMAKEHEENSKNPDFVGAQLEIDNAKSDQLVANISYGVGAAFVVTGFLFWLLSDSESSEETAILPIATPGGAGLGITFSY